MPTSTGEGLELSDAGPCDPAFTEATRKLDRSSRSCRPAAPQLPRGRAQCQLTPCVFLSVSGAGRLAVTHYPLYTSVCTGELNAIRKHKCFLCSPFYVKGVSLGHAGRNLNLKDLKGTRKAARHTFGDPAPAWRVECVPALQFRSVYFIRGDTAQYRERLVIYCQTAGVSAAHATHCATYCTPCRPLRRAFSGWIRTPPPTAQYRTKCHCQI